MDVQEYKSSIFDMYFGGMKYATFDIETTGLSPEFCSVILSGFADYSTGKLTSRQYFAENRGQELDVLERTAEELSEVDFVITYNGATFDIPFVAERMKRNGLRGFTAPYNFDLFQIARKYSSVRSFVPNLRQKTLENFLGLWEMRTDEIDGGVSVQLYFDYLASHDPEVKKKIFLHNHDDVLQLYRLLDLLKYADLHKAMSNMGFPVSSRLGQFLISKVRITRGHLVIQGLQPRETIISYINYGDGNLSYTFDNDGTFAVKLRLKKSDGMFLADLQGNGIETDVFADYSTFGSGYLILAAETGNHMEMNMLSKTILERIIEYEL